jgi:methionine--tRNA ligase beta chain
MISLEQFQSVELIVARITEVREHPSADRLYVLKIDTGNGEKQLVAGIRRSYPPQDLIGRKIVVVNNLQPAVIRGEESCGMLLAAGDDQGVTLIGPDRDVPAGSRVR